MAKRNAEVVLKYSTLYPFRTTGKTLMCVYCCDRIEDPDEFRCHMDEMHKTVDIHTAFAHTKRRDDFRLKVDCVNLKCRICSKSLDTVADVPQHLIDHHETKDIKDIDLSYEVGLHPYRLIKDKFVCLVCEFKLPTLTKLTRHMTSHYADYACDACDRRYTNEENLRNHIKFGHSEKHICRKCMLVFATLEEKKEHLKTSTQCWSTMCTHCGERFPSWDQKQKHLVSKHNVQPLTYPCPDCDIVFKSRYHFYHHYNTTHSELALVCSYCGKKCRSKSFLETHLVIHTGDRKFQCNVCSKAFIRMRGLQDHMWTHSETKRYPCQICDMAFCQKRSFTSHMTNTHPDYSQ